MTIHCFSLSAAVSWKHLNCLHQRCRFSVFNWVNRFYKSCPDIIAVHILLLYIKQPHFLQNTFLNVQTMSSAHAPTHASPVNMRSSVHAGTPTGNTRTHTHTHRGEQSQSVESVTADSEVESHGSPWGQMKIYEMYTQSSLWNPPLSHCHSAWLISSLRHTFTHKTYAYTVAHTPDPEVEFMNNHRGIHCISFTSVLLYPETLLHAWTHLNILFPVSSLSLFRRLSPSPLFYLI